MISARFDVVVFCFVAFCLFVFFLHSASKQQICCRKICLNITEIDSIAFFFFENRFTHVLCFY